MLLVKTYVAPSKIDGLGLFAAEPIPAGTVWWRLHEAIDRVFTSDELDALPPMAREHVQKSGFAQDGKFVMCGDDARFVNHAFDAPSIPHDSVMGSITTRRIEAGEEIVEDYTLFDENVRPFMRR